MFGDNLSVIKSTVVLAGKPQRPSHIFNWNRTRKAQIKGIIKFVHIIGNDNPTGIVTNSRAYNTWYPLMNPLLFWRDMDFLKDQVVSEGSENRSQTPPLYQAKGIPHESFNIDPRHILCD